MSEATPGGRRELHRGLPMVAQWDPEALAREEAELAELETRGPLTRTWAYARKIGPGWVQSAITLGSGSAFSSLFAGALLGYSLIWVQPLAMLLGIVMLAAVAYQTLSTGVRPFDAMRRYVHPAVAWAWVLASLAATVIWHFPQYACGAAVSADLVALAGWPSAPHWLFGIAMLVLCTAITWLYGSGARGIRLYENLLKVMVGTIIVAFLLVVLKTGVNWRALWRGLAGFPGNVPRDAKGVSVMMGGLAAAVGINQTFLFPYTLLARGWGKAHRRLSKYDLGLGMGVPFILATGFLVVAAANTLYNNFEVNVDTGVTPWGAAHVFAGTMGLAIGRVIFGIGVLGMALSTISVHMLVAGFIVCEVLRIEPTGWRYRLAVLVPIPGVLGTVFWRDIRLWIAVPTSATCGLLLPIAYIGFLILHNRRDYMGDAKPTGLRAAGWNLAMGAAILAVSASGIYYVYVKYLKAEGEYTSPAATYRTLCAMAEGGHKARVFACFDTPSQDKIRDIEKAAAAPAGTPSFIDALVDRIERGKLEVGNATIEGNKAQLEIKVDGQSETVAFVKEGHAWKITRIGMGLRGLDEWLRQTRADAGTPPQASGPVALPTQPG